MELEIERSLNRVLLEALGCALEQDFILMLNIRSKTDPEQDDTTE